jgi:hypothetical protein
MSDDVQSLHERNARVDADKAWETSKTRRAGIALLTYIVACLYMFAIGVQDVMLNALIPTCGFLLSTLSLGTIKKFWLRAVYQPKGLS